MSQASDFDGLLACNHPIEVVLREMNHLHGIHGPDYWLDIGNGLLALIFPDGSRTCIPHTKDNLTYLNAAMQPWWPPAGVTRCPPSVFQTAYGPPQVTVVPKNEEPEVAPEKPLPMPNLPDNDAPDAWI